MATTKNPDDEFLERFKALTIEHAVASENGDFERANRAVDMTTELIRKVWINGGRTKDALRPLTKLVASDDARIALKAVVYTAELFPEVEAALPRLMLDKGLAGLGAKYTLDNVRQRKLRVLREILGTDMPDSAV